MNKEFFGRLLAILMISVLNMGIASCGGSDNDDDENPNANPNEQQPVNTGEQQQQPEASRFFIGNWRCTVSSGSIHYFTFSANGAVVYVLAQPTYKQGQLIENSMSKHEGTWRYEKADEHSGLLYTTIDGFATIAIMNTAENYWNGITTGGIELTARKLADNDFAANHYVGTWVGCSVCYETGKCQTCSGSGKCRVCSGRGQIYRGPGKYDACTSCSGSGSCSSCNGSGNCSSCGGLGGHTNP